MWLQRIRSRAILAFICRTFPPVPVMLSANNRDLQNQATTRRLSNFTSHLASSQTTTSTTPSAMCGEWCVLCAQQTIDAREPPIETLRGPQHRRLIIHR